MQEIDKFTQVAYLNAAAVRGDSRVIETEELAYVITPSSLERWYNAVSRCLLPPDRFDEINQLIEQFGDSNFNWHLWPDSSPQLLDFLVHKLRFQEIGTASFLTKTLKVELKSYIPRNQIVPLSDSTFDSYLQAKMHAWNNSADQISEIEKAALYSMNNPKHSTFVLLENRRVLAAVSSYSDSNCAYLRGDFVVPEHRGRGLYKELIQFRETELIKSQIHTLAVIADEETSAPIYKKMNYSFKGKIRVLAKKHSRWVSL